MEIYYKIFLIYIAIISAVSIIVTIYDKCVSKTKKRRISENTLLLLSALGGSAAMLITMLIIRHKTSHAKFMLLIPLMIIIQFIGLLYLYFMIYIPNA